MEWEEYIRNEEDKEYGNALMESLARYFSCDPTEASVKRSLYKDTECGAWIRIEEGHPARVVIGSIVEGSDAEVVADGIPYVPEDDDEQDTKFHAALEEAIKWVEGEVDVLWNEANDEEEDV